MSRQARDSQRRDHDHLVWPDARAEPVNGQCSGNTRRPASARSRAGRRSRRRRRSSIPIAATYMSPALTASSTSWRSPRAQCGRPRTYDPGSEKIAGGLNIADGELIVVTTDKRRYPAYQGQSSRSTWPRQDHPRFNTLCSNVRKLIDPPTKCHASDSAIWGRPGSVIEPDTGNILVATGNGPFNGHTNWGDSVLEPRRR